MERLAALIPFNSYGIIPFQMRSCVTAVRMIRMTQNKSVEKAKDYFQESLAQSDYYLNEQELQGVLQGKVAARLGLGKVIDKDVFYALCDNLNPFTGKPLTLRNIQNRTVAYDINFHCPKSVSLLHALTKDSHILDAFRDSVNEIMRLIEADAETRVRKSGKDENRNTGEFLWVDFIHQTARPVDGATPDPHLHCHCFTFNVTWDAVEQQYKAVQFQNIKRDMPYYQAFFHKNLSDKLIDLGYQIRRTRTAFEIIGVPQKAIDLFSKRSDAIGRFAAENNITNAQSLNDIGARTRSKKQNGLSMDELKKDWRQQIEGAGFTEGGAVRFAPTLPLPHLSAQDCIDYSLSHRFERASVAQERQLLETACRHSIGNKTVALEAILERFNEEDSIIRIQENKLTLCSTLEVLAEEQKMVALAQEGIGRMIPIYQVAPFINLDGEQAEAVQSILTTSNQLSIIQGRAGTGKTTLMKECISHIEKSGQKVWVVAPTAQASRGVLKDEGFENAETLAYLLSSAKMQSEIKDAVLWVDEAGLLGVRDMCALLEIAKQKNVRIILSGDTRQHSSVVRGDALRILNKIAGIKSVDVSRIYRQRNQDYRAAVQALSDGDIKTAFEKLNAIGAIKETTQSESILQVANDYCAAIKKGKTALVIAPTHKQGDLLNHAIRHNLQQSGQIALEEVAVLRLCNKQLTAAEKTDCRNYQENDAVQFSQNLKGIERGSRWQICCVNESEIIIEDAVKKRIALPLQQSKHFEVYRQETLHVAKGDTLCINRNGFDEQGRRLNNGQLLQVMRIDKLGTIHLQHPTSKVQYCIPKDFGHMSHAHCITSYAAQGKTVNEVFIAETAATFAATDLKQFYVSVSRGRDAVHLYTDDVESLLFYAAQTGDRLSAMELLQKQKAVEEHNDEVVRQSGEGAQTETIVEKIITPKSEVSWKEEVNQHEPKQRIQIKL